MGAINSPAETSSKPRVCRLTLANHSTRGELSCAVPLPCMTSTAHVASGGCCTCNTSYNLYDMPSLMQSAAAPAGVALTWLCPESCKCTGVMSIPIRQCQSYQAVPSCCMEFDGLVAPAAACQAVAVAAVCWLLVKSWVCLQP